MAYSLRKFQMVVIALVLTMTGAVHGMDWDSAEFVDVASTPSEAPRAPCEEPCVPESCCNECCGQFFVGAQLLYFRAYEGGLSSVCDITDITDSTVDGILVSTLEGRGHDPDFRWNPAYRIGVGYQFAECNCGIGAYWTHFKSDTGGDDDDDDYNSWNLDFDVVDALYACEYNWSDCFVLTPFAGLRYARIEQKLRSNFISTTDGIVSTISTGESKERFVGAGPLVGVDGDWGFGCGFSLYGNVSVGLLYGTFHVRSDLSDTFSTGINVTHTRRHTQALQPVLDAGFGIRWRTCLCDCNELVVQLGLETHRYFNHNQFCDYGDLSLDGASFGIGMVF